MKNDKKNRLEGKVAIITGAGSGIGRAAAVLFANEGAKLVLADWNEDGLDETLGLVLNAGAEAITKKTNVSVENEIRQLIELALRTYSVVDIVCNNAGITGQLTSLEEQDAARLATGLWGKCFWARSSPPSILPNICRNEKPGP